MSEFLSVTDSYLTHQSHSRIADDSHVTVSLPGILAFTKQRSLKTCVKEWATRHRQASLKVSILIHDDCLSTFGIEEPVRSTASTHLSSIATMTSRDSLYIGDAWPQMPDGSDWDSKELMSLTSEGKGPFAKDWDVQLLIAELEQKLGSKVLDVPIVEKGSNNYVSGYWLASSGAQSPILTAGHTGLPCHFSRQETRRCQTGQRRCQHA